MEKRNYYRFRQNFYRFFVLLKEFWRRYFSVNLSWIIFEMQMLYIKTAVLQELLQKILSVVKRKIFGNLFIFLLTRWEECVIISPLCNYAGVAQPVEQLIRNQQVRCSSHPTSSNLHWQKRHRQKFRTSVWNFCT